MRRWLGSVLFAVSGMNLAEPMAVPLLRLIGESHNAGIDPDRRRYAQASQSKGFRHQLHH